jgi:hypothetical protein
MSYSALPTCAGCKVTIYGTPIPVQGEDHCSVECCWDAGQAAGYLNAAADAEDYPSLEDNLERAQRRIGELVAERDRLLDEVERWKLASGLEDGRGDPDGVTPEAMQRYWEGFEANHRDLQRTVKERLDRLATICGCPEWDYPGQIVRDVEAVAKERNRLRAALVEALEWGDEGWSYASDYFREKWNYAGERARIAAALTPDPEKP